jgi:hypothetical protein
MAKRIGLANRYTSARKEVEGRAYLFNSTFKEGIPIEHVGYMFDDTHKGQVWNLLDYFDNGYVVVQGDKEAILLMQRLWNEDSERLNLQGRIKGIASNGQILLLFLLDPSGKKRLHEFGIKSVPYGVVSITVKNEGNSILFDLWVPSTEKMKIKFVNDILKTVGTKEEVS